MNYYYFMKKIRNIFAVFLIGVNFLNPIVSFAQYYEGDLNSSDSGYYGYVDTYYGTSGNSAYYNDCYGSCGSNYYYEGDLNSSDAGYYGYVDTYYGSNPAYYNDCYNCSSGSIYYGNTGTYYGTTGSTYYGNSGSYYYGSTYSQPTYYYGTTYQTTPVQPVICPVYFHLSNGTCVQDTKLCNGSYIPINQTCIVQVTCSYPYVNQNNNCVIQNQTCWDGAVVPVNQSCPSQTRQCPNGQVLPVTTPCPQQTQTCWDGSVILTTQSCPQQYKTCLDGRVVLVSQTCGKYCSNGVFVLETATCTRICPDGNSYPENVACPIYQNRPSVDLNVTKTLVNRGESVTLSWVSSNASSCTASNFWSGSKSVNGSEVRYNLQGNSTFTITCYNLRGESATDSVFVNVREVSNINISRVVTTVPTKISKTTATCNGIAIIANNLNTTGWFEYGTTEALGSTTNVGNIGSSLTTPFSNTLSGLKSNTKYYCRAVIANSQGTFKGEIMSFKTEGSSVVYVPPVVTKPTPTKPSKPVLVCYDASGNKDETLDSRKAIELSIEKYSGSLQAGSVVEYRVKYTNVSQITVANTELRVVIPKELQFLSASRGNFNSDRNELVVNVDDLRSNESGEVFLRAKVADKIDSGKTIVATAYVSYEVLDSNRDIMRDEVTAYTISTLGDKSDASGDVYDNENNSQNANVKSDRSFLPDSILEWLAVIALILVLIFLGKRIKDEFSDKKVDDHGHH